MLENPRLPVVDDGDIRWATQVLELPAEAFFGRDGTDPRAEVLRTLGTIDVPACPGSGKTTVLVAKLAILARKWQQQTRGICVLSHTNVARDTIESALAGAGIGRTLMSYPHYVGTIHGFISEFLALPWMRRCGLPIRVIDNSICHERRWNQIPFGTRFFLEKKNLGCEHLRIADSTFAIAGVERELPFGPKTKAAQALSAAFRKVAYDGYHCFDDLFMWAREMITACPYMVSILRDRFPLLFIDESQDTSQTQSELLHEIFVKGTHPVVRQRFGDSNQAIFDSVKGTEPTTDVFPGSPAIPLPNSHRFGQNIATFADPLAIVPQGLIGHGPNSHEPGGAGTERHTVFLFDTASVRKVLPAYAKLLLNTFSAEQLKVGRFAAVGQVHRPPLSTNGTKYPHHLGDYWPEYACELTARNPQARTLWQFLALATTMYSANADTAMAVEQIAESILRIAILLGTQAPTFRRKHQLVLESLKETAAIRSEYLDVVDKLLLKREKPSKSNWEADWVGPMIRAAECVAGIKARIAGDLKAFVEWEDAPAPSFEISSGRRPNVFCYPLESPQVAIHAGSIHSVKGQTHTSTLVLETFWQDKNSRHNMELLLPWLTGKASGAGKAGVQQRCRLRLHYVAMTRPSHLLCLALKRSCVSEADIEKIANRGWRVEKL